MSAPRELGHDQFPSLLREIHDAPSRLHVRGMLHYDRPYVAIVGTRKASAAGKDFARSLAHDLGRSGFVIVSGLAFGIDAAAHQGALDAHAPTVAVLAGGVLTPQPRSHTSLAESILQGGGALLSEHDGKESLFPYHFLKRNRIVSGLSLAVIVVEAPERSGALSTARFALEEGRDVYVVPGPVHNPNYAGSHNLIQDGAHLITSSDDVISLLGISHQLDNKNENAVGSQASGDERAIVEYLTTLQAPASLDDIHQATQLDARDVARIVSLLVIQSIIKEDRGRYYI